MKLVEECVGVGDLVQHGELLRRVSYRINRYQEMLPSGMPLPGKHRIEGTIDADAARGTVCGIDTPVTLKLEDGRTMALTIDAEGRVFAEGHGPRGGCSCC